MSLHHLYRRTPIHSTVALVAVCRSVERPRFVPVALGLVAGLLICASLPPWGWWPLAIAGVALWLHVLGSGPRLQRFAAGYCVGIGWFAPSMLWMWGLTPPGYVVSLLLGWGPLVGLVSIAAGSDRRRLFTLPAAIVLFEWFHDHAPFGGVPLSLMSMSQTRAPLLPIATIGGSLLLSAAVAACGSALYVAVHERRWQEPVAVVATLGVLCSAGILWPAGASEGTVHVAVVQGGGPQGTRYTSDQGPLVVQRHLDATATIDSDSGVDLVLWPENAINVEGAFVDSPWGPMIAAEAVRLGATIVVGVVEDAPDDPQRFLNYVLVYEPDGSVGARYDKERRVPFGEYVPMRPLFEPIAAGVLPPRDQVPGNGSAAIDTDAGPLAVAISWEVFFSRRIREGVRDGGEIVINPTNGSSYWLTQVQTQQLATSALRAAESRRWLLQAAPTGFSGVFDDRGGLLQHTAISEQTVLYADVPRLTGTTPAQALGALPALVAAGVALTVAEVGRRRARRSERNLDHTE